MPGKRPVGTAAVSTDVWHRHLGHPHEAVVRAAAAKVPQSGIDLRDPMTACDVCLANKSTQQVHPKYTTTRKAASPLDRVHTDLIAPLALVAKGGF